MYCVFILFAVALTASADDAEEFKNCMKKLDVPHLCCKKHTIPLDKKNMEGDDVKECLAIPHNPDSCERELCFGMKKGFASADGTIDKKKLLEDIKTKIPDKDLVALFKEKCIDGDLDAYGEADSCDMKKMHNCLRWQFKSGCLEFSDEGPCKGMQDTINDCKEFEP